MAKKKSIFTIRRRGPQIRLTAKGIRVTKPSISLGTKNARVNISSTGPSVSVRGRGATYNTRRGCILSPFTLLANLFKRR